MTRQTSITSYYQIKDEGLLGKLQFEAYECFVKHGPMTQGELWKNHFPNRQRHDVAPRVNELHKKGLLRCIAERPCQVTGRQAMVWEATNNLPSKINSVSPRQLRKDQAIKYVKDGISRIQKNKLPTKEQLITYLAKIELKIGGI